ncbi:DUF4384 domain-containing protein [Thermodesulfovibrio sp. 3907-1M]|uniref:DUF4384 domain-containing protein n=1 Tax=Thermodesulfovibrio autotrophicus TaxID=3118333 RepID=A0AAU8GX22_9BACT
MRIKLFIVIILPVLFTSYLYGAQSTITESEGYACMSEDRTKRQTEETALQDAKRKAIEQVSTYIQVETQVKDFELQNDIIKAYANAKVRVIDSQAKWDTGPPKVGDCYRIKIKAEVIPDEEAMKRLSQAKELDDPSAPLKVQLWTDKKEYHAGERIKIFLRGNKPFYARVVYRQADGSLVQILPNPYRKDNYFQGGVVYEIPSGPDRFELEVTPPFGEESIIVYASTGELGTVDLEPAGGVYKIRTKLDEIADKTRGVQIIEKGQSKATEFFEIKLNVQTK